MKKIAAFLVLPLLCSCSQQVPSSSDSAQAPTAYIQEREQLGIEVPAGRAPLNFREQVGRWFPYTEYDQYIRGRSEEGFRQEVQKRFSDAAAEGVNTVYLHARPSGDAYYRSELFPPGALLDGDYDPLAIMTEEAHKQGLSVHAWVNPLRLQTREQMENVPDTYITKQWASDPELPYAKLVGDRWYLDPAYSEVRELIAEGVTEILENYDVDGIHIDDYFYPTTEESFDREAFERSGSSDLAQWRRDNVTAMVKGIYDAVKAHDGRQVFGISPQGNIAADLDGQYADVRLWAGEKGYCDYILPQIYYGFRNESLPFEETLQAWEELRGDSGVGLIIGLAGYKEGKPDKWAGAGEQEWVEDSGVIERQIAAVKASGADGYAVYY